MSDVRACAWCRREIPATARSDARFCSRICRQTAFRLRERGHLATSSPPATRKLRFGYGDPPYPGKAAKYYRDQPTYKGEVDHVELIARLSCNYAGWALSTSERALRSLLPLCPEGARVCPWVKPIGVSKRTWGMHNAWEPVIVYPGRHLRPGRRDWLRAQPARKGGTLPGRKPIAFCAWLFGLLGMLPGDELDDIFPGTDVVGWAWTELSSSSSNEAKRARSRLARGERSTDEASTTTAQRIAVVGAGVDDTSERVGDASSTAGDRHQRRAYRGVVDGRRRQLEEEGEEDRIRHD